MKNESAKNYPKFFKDIESYFPEEVSKISEEDGENAIIYGTPCLKIEKGHSYEGFIFLSESLSDYITFSNKSQDNIEKLSIKNIHQITFNNDTENLKEYKKKNKDEIFFQILIGQKFYDFGMKEKKDLLLVIKGLLSIFSKKIIKSEESIEGHLIELINKYDLDSDNKYNNSELQLIFNKLGISAKLLKMEFDLNHDGEVSIDELIQYIKSKTSGENLKEVFEKYSSKNDNNEYKMNQLNLKKFFYEIQEEPLSDLEAYQLLINFKNGIDTSIKRKINKKIENAYTKNDKKICDEKIQEIIEKVRNKYKIETKIELNLDLKEFNNMLNSPLLTVYKMDKMNAKLNLDRPLTDYFIKSSHNTYITGHQLSGTSSSKLYSLCLLEGYRLVELDCYNGSGDDIVITHGYTLVSKLKLDDVLKELKSSAFINSSMPVILSIENHLDENHQNIMAKKLKEILGDLYIFPYDTKPEFLPTLKEMKNKFIVKCGGKRLWTNEDIKKAEIKSDNNEIDKEKTKKYVYLDNLKDATDSDEEQEPKKEEEEVDQNIFKYNLNKTPEMEESLKSIRKQSYENNEANNNNREIKNKEKSNESEKETENNTIQNLEKIRGLPGTSYKSKEIEKKHYQPWECLTIKDKKFIEYCSKPEKYKRTLKLSQHCVLKAYPTSFSSNNYDIIKCWLCGCQIAALNIQALEDDYTLYNTVFFYQNQKCGFVLKPDKLLDPNYEKINDKPLYNIKIRIISGYNFINLMETKEDAIIKKENIDIEIYSLGSEYDDKNKHKKYEIKGGLMFPEIYNNKIEYEAPIYEYDLGGIIIKFNYGGKMFGRACIPYCLMKNGYRKIPLFDNDCYICDGAFLLGYFHIRQINN